MIRQILEFITPAICGGCGHQGELICGVCREEIPVVAPCCEFCNRTAVDGLTCGACSPTANVHSVTVAADYTGVTRDLIRGLKFDRRRAAARPLGRLIAGRLASAASPRAFDCVAAVPLAPARRRERGYNQSELLAKAVARELALPYRRALDRLDSAHQIGLNRQDRLRAIKGKFYTTRRLGGENILLVDDVMTTGATLAECARTLKAAGAGEIHAAVVAKNLSNR